MSRRIVVFAGPSLALADRADHGRIEFRPPAACGDLYAVARAAERPAAIGLIDGLFETAASPWHKEILWALSRGIPVAGAASLGALRAAEMRPFGMIGCGAIYRAFAAGRLTDDDEVAIEHGPAELGWRPISEPLVNIRASLARAVRAGVATPREARDLVAVAKDLFYKDRRYDALLARAARERVLAAARCRSLARWLRTHAVDAKRDDALALLRRLRRGLAAPAPRPRFIGSRYWDSFTDGRG